MTTHPKDRFSTHAASYAAFRPTYPKEMYDFIFSTIAHKEIAWDCATGNGQVARDLAKEFKKIWATDISAKQIENAIRFPNIEYSIAPAHKTSIPTSSVNLITVGQALHWFDIPAFFKEVIRVAKPDAILAVWGYGLLKIVPQVNDLVSDFYLNVIGPYWDPERKLVDDHYQSLPFPFAEIHVPEFAFSFEWSQADLQGYLTTWSSVQKYIKVHGRDPVPQLMEKLKPLLKSEKIKVEFPLFLRMGRIVK